MGESLKRIGLITGLAFGVALAVVIGVRLPASALAVVVGLGCGVGAGLPTSLMVLAVVKGRQRDGERERLERRGTYWGQPPVVVVSPPVAQQTRRLPAGDYGGGYGVPVGDRQFVVVGDAEVEDEGGWR